MAAEYQQSDPTPSITYRWLLPFEYPMLAPFFESQNATMPKPHLSHVYAAFEDGMLIAFWVLQAILHAEPLFVVDEHRGNGVLLYNLLSAVEPFMRNETVMILAETEEVEQMAERLGFVRLPEPAYIRLSEAESRDDREI